MKGFMYCGILGTKEHTQLRGVREEFPEEGVLGPALKNHTSARPSDEVGRGGQRKGVAIPLDG